MKKSILLIFILLALTFVLVVLIFLRKPANFTQDADWGISFSKYSAEASGLDWREVYLAILDDLKPKQLRLPVYWKEVEREPGKYYFSDYDWLVEEAEKRNIKLILAIGRKAPRWPASQLPDWAIDLEEPIQQSKTLDLNSRIITRYRNLNNLYFWQIEDEPYWTGQGFPKLNNGFLNKEIKLAKSLDSEHPILITDKGTFGFWLPAAGKGDALGISVYNNFWNSYWGYYKFSLPYQLFWVKANLVSLFYPQKPLIISELEGEYWEPCKPYETSLDYQLELMPLAEFRKNIEKARKIGFKEIYFRGAEWWYWLKVERGNAEFWEEAKKVMGK